MNTLHNRLLIGIPFNAIPATGTKAHEALKLYLSGDSVLEQTLCDTIGRNYRAQLQQLSGDRYRHWNFINEIENGEIISRHLDPRHLSQSRELDTLARAERRRELKNDSYSESVMNASRLPQATRELHEAMRALSEATADLAIEINNHRNKRESS